MRIGAALSHLPLRIASGAYILNAGLGKRSATPERAAQLHGLAKGAYPQLDTVAPDTFTRALSLGEMALGAALLNPFVSSRLAGLALGSFASGLLGLYWKTPGMHGEGSVRPSEQGSAIAKDVWLLGIGLSLILDGGRGHHKRRSAKAAKSKGSA